MAYETQLAAFERAMADVVTAFGEWPDTCLSRADLNAAFFAQLLATDVLSVLYRTRDGRRTPLVHQQYALASAHDHELWGSAGMDGYDIVLLNPSFVRSSEFDAVARNTPQRVAGLGARGERILPLLAAANLVVADRLSGDIMGMMERRFFDLVNAEGDALRAYLGVFLRQWELDDEAQQGLLAIESWARQYPYVSMCCVQSYRDRAGHVFAGRYLNDWKYEAPLLPMELPTTRPVHSAVALRQNQSDDATQTLAQSL
jgi:hypothetical protein